MATRRNVGNDISKHVTTIQQDEIHIRNESTGAMISHPYGDNKGNGNGRYHRILSRRAIALGFAVAVAVLVVVSMVSLIVKTESSIAKDDTRLRQSHHFFNNSIPKRLADVEVDKKPETTTIISQDKDGNNSTEKPLEIYLTFEDPPIFEAPIINPKTKDFDPNIAGVVVTKIQGATHLRALRQMLCLFTKAYNNRVNHDIIVFTSEELDQKDVEELGKIVSPAKMIVEVDNPGLQKMVDDLSPSRKSHLLERCNAKSSSELSWYTKCSEVGSYKTIKGERIAYNWQAEFRTLWLWTHPVLKPYKYMMWMDSDVFCTRIWNQDPIATMERHDLALVRKHIGS